jgi:hypothetical protein
VQSQLLVEHSHIAGNLVVVQVEVAEWPESVVGIDNNDVCGQSQGLAVVENKLKCEVGVLLGII